MVSEMLACPFCKEDDFDEIGLCLHLAMHCPAYDNACRRASDEADRREARQALTGEVGR
jgi:hypothetical protein